MAWYNNIGKVILNALNIDYAPQTIAPRENAEQAKTNLNTYIANVQLQRIRQDAQSWREAIVEAELAYYPHRVKQQRLYLDTAQNGHVVACMNTYKDLVLLKDFKICDSEGNENEEWTKYFRAQWFYLFMNYALDADFYGYNLIALGDMVNYTFPNLTIIKRHNISPDRLQVTPFVYSLSGVPFLEGDVADWHIWVPTPTENAISTCGYGLLYKVGIYEIFLRNILGFNGDFVEMFAQPYRVGRTTKTNEDERAVLEQALQMMGSAGYAVLDDTDTIEFLETSLGGNGYKGYESLEQRCQKYISKIILGHADALDSVPGKLGAGQGEDSPVAQALRNLQVKLCRKIEADVNDKLIPKIQKLGVRIPQGLRFEFKNDEEKEEFRRKEDESNKVTAEIFKTIKDAGGKPDWKYFTERTGIEVEEAPEPEPIKAPTFRPDIANKLRDIYEHKH